MITLFDISAFIRKTLENYDPADRDGLILDAQTLLKHHANISTTTLHAYPEKSISPQIYKQWQADFQTLIKGKPLDAILGESVFWGEVFHNSPLTLLPRAATECLIHIVQTELIDLCNQPIKLLDLGTGTGVIGITLAHLLPHWQVHGVDLNEAIVQIAQDNAKNLGCSNFSASVSHWYDDLPVEKFDLIISNPPYIAPHDPHLNTLLDYEPASALISENNGLSDIQIIISQAPLHLKEKGYLLIEHGYDQAQAVAQFMTKHSFQTQLFQDNAQLNRACLGQYLPPL